MGGVEAVLRGHWERDRAFGVDSSFIIYVEKNNPPLERVHFLAFDDDTTPKSAREAVAKAAAIQKPDVCVYHGSWIMNYFADVDYAQRRVLQSHGSPAGHEELLRAAVPFVDAFAAISPPQFEAMRRALPEFQSDRIERLSCPIFPPKTESAHPPLKNRPLVIGYCGRLSDDAKRVDRAPDFVAALNAAGLDYRLEFLGEGQLEPALKQKFAGAARIVFHGRKSGDEYWRILRAWDVLILFSDSEGTPISILETMDQGVLPLMPGINSGADYYANQLGARFVYPPWDFSRACDTIRWLLEQPQTEIDSLRHRSREIVAAHHAENYFAAFAAYMNRILSLPRRSTQTPSLPPWPFTSVSFKSMAALSRLRARLRP
jgi:glycosyltransferase involved in cell wall biosynthesis